jgi:esterase/lipase superfamily enzyme
LFSGSGDYEDPNASKSFARLLYDKGINYELDIWGDEWRHDWETWRKLLPHYLGSRF